MGQRQKVCDLAVNQKGSSGITYYKWYGYKVRVPWCAIFVSWVMDQGGLKQADLREHPNDYAKQEGQSLISKGCDQLFIWYSKNNCIVNSTAPVHPGDVIFYDYDSPDDGPDHVGIIYKIGESSYFTVEGNVDDTVQCREVSKNDKKIYCICRPKYTMDSLPGITIRKGSSGDQVRILQSLISAAGYDLEIDGRFGAVTKDAVMMYQREQGITVDGVVGSETWSRLIK